MRLHQNPVFRKVIIPWYDSDKTCFLMIFLMIVVLLFGVLGILVASETYEYHEYIWLPITLVILSSTVIVSTIIRLIKRYSIRFSK